MRGLRVGLRIRVGRRRRLRVFPNRPNPNPSPNPDPSSNPNPNPKQVWAAYTEMRPRIREKLCGSAASERRLKRRKIYSFRVLARPAVSVSLVTVLSGDLHCNLPCTPTLQPYPATLPR